MPAINASTATHPMVVRLIQRSEVFRGRHWKLHPAEALVPGHPCDDAADELVVRRVVRCYGILIGEFRLGRQAVCRRDTFTQLGALSRRRAALRAGE